MKQGFGRLGVLIFIACCLLRARADEPEALAGALVYLEMVHPVSEMVGTNRLGVFYGLPGHTNFIRKTESSFGTAFFLIHNKRSYIVTAAHVVGDPDDNGTLHLINKSGGKQDLNLSEIRRALPGAKWFIHPKADVAIHPYAYAMGVGNMDLLENLVSTNRLPLLSSVMALGFPLGLGTYDSTISPVATECSTSSWLTTMPNEQPFLHFFLLDKPLAQGYSGAPIFTREKGVHESGFIVPGGPSLLVGICHAEIGDALGAKHAIIVPACYILETFQLPEFVDFEKTR